MARSNLGHDLFDIFGKLTEEERMAKDAVARVKDGPLPSAADETKFSYLQSAWPALRAATRVLLATDNDAPGAALADELARRTNSASLGIIDVRNDVEWAGKDNTACCKRRGHIPRAAHIEWTKFLKNGRFKSPEEITALLEAHRVTPHGEIVVYCHRGARSANILPMCSPAIFRRRAIRWRCPTKNGRSLLGRQNQKTRNKTKVKSKLISTCKTQVGWLPLCRDPKKDKKAF